MKTSLHLSLQTFPAALFLLFVSLGHSFAAPTRPFAIVPGCAGSLDPSFNAGSGFSIPPYVMDANLTQTLAVQPDGKLLVGGNFTDALGVPESGLARLNTDGSLDTTFGPAQGYLVRVVVLQPDGRILVGANGSGYDGGGGPQVYGLVRLNSNGSLDSTFNPAWAPYDVRALALQPDGRILVGGELSEEGQKVYRVIRLESNGVHDATFATSNLFIGPQMSLLLQADGKVIVAARDDEEERGELTRLNNDGSLDTSFVPDVQPSGITAAALQSDGKILLGGSFSSNAVPAFASVIRLNADGTRDTSFDSTLAFRIERPWYGVTPMIDALSVDSAGRVLVGGLFDYVNGAPRSLLARLNADGTLDESFQPNIAIFTDGDEPPEVVKQIALAPDGKIFIGGRLTAINGLSRHSVARLFADGNDCIGVISLAASSYVVSETAGGLSVTVERRGDTNQSAAVSYRGWGWIDDNFEETYNVYAEGVLTFAAGETLKSVLVPISDNLQLQRNRSFSFDLRPAPGGAVLGIPSEARIVIVDDEAAGLPGSIDGSYRPAFRGGSGVMAMALQPDGKLIVDVVSGPYPWTSLRSTIQRLNADGSIDPTLNVAFTGICHAVAFDAADNTILVSGDFGTNGNPRLIRLSGNGVIDPSFAPQVDGSVFALLLLSNRDILIGGAFQHAGGAARTGVARLGANGSIDTGFQPSLMSGATIRSLAVQGDNKIIVAGLFTEVNGNARTNIARLNADGGVDASFAASLIAQAYTVKLDMAGRILVGSATGLDRLNEDGSFDTNFARYVDRGQTFVVQPDGRIIVNGTVRLNLDGTHDASFFAGSGPVGNVENVRTTLLQANGDVLVGGWFYTFNELDFPALVRLHGGSISPSSHGRIEFATPRLDVSENAGVATLTVRRSFGSSGAVTATYTTADRTALAGRDYAAQSGTVSFADGEAGEKTIAVPVIDNQAAGLGPREFSVTITNASGGAIIGLNGLARVNIVEDELGVTFSAQFNRIVMPPNGESGPTMRINEGSGSVRIVATRVGPTNAAFSVHLSTSDGTAIAGVDYTAVSTNLQFAAGERARWITLPIVDDTTPEEDETVLLTLSNPSPGVVLGPYSSMTLIISDNDRPRRVVPHFVGRTRGTLGMTLDVPPMSWFFIQTSTNLVDWGDVVSFYRGEDDDPIFFEDVGVTNHIQQFYRLRFP